MFKAPQKHLCGSFYKENAIVSTSETVSTGLRHRFKVFNFMYGEVGVLSSSKCRTII